MNGETMFVLTEDGEGIWEKYDDTYDISIHCRSREENERVMKIINEAAKILKESEGEQMKNDFMIQRAKELAAKAINEKAGSAVTSPEDMYVVWFSKTLQNWKALVSTSILNSDSEYGDYVEVTHNGDKGETYCDVYKKQRNVCYKDGENK